MTTTNAYGPALRALLLVVALVLFILAALGWPPSEAQRLPYWAAAAFVASFLIP